MFPARYFGARYYPPRYFGKVGADAAGQFGYFGHRYFGAVYYPPRYFSPFTTVTLTVVASRHRAQYSGIELPKRSKKKKRRELAPIALTLRSIEPGSDRAACRLDYRNPFVLAACEPCADTLAPVKAGVTYALSMNAREPSLDTARMTATYRSDEDEAMEALFNLMPWLRAMKIKEDA